LDETVKEKKRKGICFVVELVSRALAAPFFAVEAQLQFLKRPLEGQSPIDTHVKMRNKHVLSPANEKTVSVYFDIFL